MLRCAILVVCQCLAWLIGFRNLEILEKNKEGGRYQCPAIVCAYDTELKEYNMLNPFVPKVVFLYPLNTSQNRKVFLFWGMGYKNETFGKKWVKLSSRAIVHKDSHAPHLRHSPIYPTYLFIFFLFLHPIFSFHPLLRQFLQFPPPLPQQSTHLPPLNYHLEDIYFQ